MRPDPLRVLAHALRAGDDRLAALLIDRLFPWARQHANPTAAPPAARLALHRLELLLRI
jgi:hypothetical protein